MSFLTSPGSGTITYQSFLLKTNAGTIFSSRFIKNLRTASVPHMWQSCFSLVSPQCSDLKYRAMLGIWESHLQRGEKAVMAAGYLRSWCFLYRPEALQRTL